MVTGGAAHDVIKPTSPLGLNPCAETLLSGQPVPGAGLTVAHSHRGERVAGVAAALGGELKVVVAPPVLNPLQKAVWDSRQWHVSMKEF